MKKLVLISLISTSVVLMSFRHSDEWVSFTSEEGHYSISFPGKPGETEEDNRTLDSAAYKIHFATYQASDDEVYILGWLNMSDFYPKEKTMRQMLEDSEDGAAESLNATYVKTTAIIDTGDQPYIEFTFNTGDHIGKNRICFINKYQYTMIVVCPLEAGVAGNADRFINSFRHID